MIKAILIDDEVHCLDTLNIILHDYCPEVQVLQLCLSAKQGLAAIEKHHPSLVFLDIEMPTMNGFDLLEHFSEIPFSVIFTNQDHCVQNFKRSGITGAGFSFFPSRSPFIHCESE